MGIKFSQARLHPSAHPFMNLPKPTLMKIVTAYHNLSDGFGLSLDEFREILTFLSTDLRISSQALNLLIDDYYATLDTDQNGLIDGMEFLAVLSSLSGMNKMEIVEFNLSLVDFNNIAALSFDELMLILKLTVSGLIKVTYTFPDDHRKQPVLIEEKRLENIASQIYKQLFHVLPMVEQSNSLNAISAAMRNVEIERRSIKDISEKLLMISEICTWLEYYNNSGTRYNNKDLNETLTTDVIKQIRPCFVEPSSYSHKEYAVINDSLGASFLANEQANSKSIMSNDKGSAQFQWKSQTALLTPTPFASKTFPSALPLVKISVEWIYGYECNNYNNLYYTRASDVIYTTGKYAIVYNVAKHKQRVLSHHHTQILSLTPSPDLLYAATGDDGKHSKFIIWTIDSLEIMYESPEFFTDGVVQLCFNPSGDVILAVDRAPTKTLVAVNWQQNQIIYKDSIECKICMSISVLNKNTFVMAKDDEIVFWKAYSEGYVQRSCVFLPNRTKEVVSVLLRGLNNETLYAGTLSGKILMIQNINVSKEVMGHIGMISCLCLCKDGILSAGLDSKIRSWNSTSLESRFIYDISRFASVTHIQSLNMSYDNTSILIGTKGGDIFEISALDGSDLRGGPIVQSHHNNFSVAPVVTAKIMGMDVHPSKFEYVTVGNDNTLRILDMKTRMTLKICKLNVNITCVAYAPLGDVIAVGTTNSLQEQGMCLILNEENLQILHAMRDSQYPATCLKFSPDGDTLCVAASDGSMLFYSVNDDYELLAKAKKHNEAVIAIDFSVDGEFVRSNSYNHELYFFNVDDGSHQSNIASMRDVQWHSQHCLYTWHTKTMHDERVFESVMCCTTFNLVKLSTVNEEGTSEYDTSAVNSIVNGSSLGVVRFYPYPVVENNTECLYYHGHVGPARFVRYSYDNAYALTAGEDDRVVLQWHVEENKVQNEKVNEDENEDGNAAAATTKESTAEVSSAVIPRMHQLEEIMFEFYNGTDVAEQTVALSNSKSSLQLYHQHKSVAHPRYQWIERTLLPSSVMPLYSGVDIQRGAVPTSLTDKSLFLQHVHGFETKTCRNNLAYTSSTSDIVYTTGLYGIAYNMNTKSQKIYKLHANHITAFAINKEGTFACTGEVGCPFARVAVWDTATCQTSVVIAELQVYSIVGLSFSSGGKLLAIASNDQYHTISVYDWQKNICLSKFSVAFSKILGLTFAQKDLSICVVGHEIIQFWYNIGTKVPSYLHADYGEMITNKQTYLAVVEFQSLAVASTAEGLLISFEGNRLKRVTQAHNGPVFALHASRRGDLLATGGYDGSVRIWNSSFSCLHEYNMSAVSKCHLNIVRSVAISPDNANIVIGLQGAEVIELNIKDGSQPREVNLKGHGTAIYALAAHPKQAAYVTTGDDAMLRVWDVRKRSIARSLKLELAARAVAFSSDGNFLVVGHGPTQTAGKKLAKKQKHAKEGSFTILSFDNLRLVAEIKDSGVMINTIQFSNNSKYLVVGSEDNKVYIYQQNADAAASSYSLKHTLNVHQAPIECIDISLNSQFMVTKDTGNAVAYTVLMTGSPVVNTEDIKDEAWNFYNLPQAWYTVAHWLCQLPDGRYGSDKSSLAASSNVYPVAARRSNSAQLFSSGNNNGDVILSAFPSYDKHTAGFSLYANAHTGPVSSLAFTYLDSHFISISAQDCCILQYKVVQNTSSTGTDASKTSVAKVGKTAKTGSSAYDYAAEVFANIYLGDGNKDKDKAHHWSGLIIDPTRHLNNVPVPINQVATSLEFIYGTQRRGTHTCVYYNSNYQVVYMVGNTGVVYSKCQHTQQYYSKHQQEITASSMDSTKSIMATGDRSLNIHVWDALIGGKSIKVFDHSIEKVVKSKVMAITFGNKDKNLFAIFTDGACYALYIFYSASSKWYDGIYANSLLMSTSPLYTLSYHVANDTLYAGGSDGSVYAVNIHNNGFNCNIMHNKFAFSDLHEDVHCSIPFAYKDSVSQATHNVVIYGCREGFLYVVSTETNEMLQKVSAHIGAIGGLSAIGNLFGEQESDYLLSSGQDHTLKLWSNSMVLLACYECNKFISRNVVITSTSYNPLTHSCLASTLDDELYEISLFSSSEFLVATSHMHNAATYGLAVHPSNPNVFCTVGDEGKVMIYHTKYRYVQKSFFLQYGSRAVTYNEDGTLLIVGLGIPGKENATPKDGTVAVYSTETYSLVCEEKKAKSYITSIQCAGEFSVISSADTRVYVVNTRTLNTITVLEIGGNKYPCLSVEVDSSRMFLRAMYAASKIAYFDLETNSHEENLNKVKDLEWRSHNCFYHWNTQGLFALKLSHAGEQTDGVVTSMALNNAMNLLAVGYANGVIKIFAYPVIEEHMPSHEVTRVSSFASRLQFSKDDTRLIVLDAYSGYVTQIAMRL